MSWRSYSLTISFMLLFLGAIMLLVFVDNQQARQFVGLIGAFLVLSGLVAVGVSAMMPNELTCPKCETSVRLLMSSISGKPRLEE